MKVNIPVDLQQELSQVVKNYYQQQKKHEKGKKKSHFSKDKQPPEKKSRVLQSIKSSNNGKTHKKQKEKKTKKSEFYIQQTSSTYTNINGQERKTSKHVEGDKNKIKVTTVDNNGKKNVVIIPTPQRLIPSSKCNNSIARMGPGPDIKKFAIPFRNNSFLLSGKPTLMNNRSLLNPQFL
jgi:hypothetical protein